MAIGTGSYTPGSGIPDPEGPTYDPFRWGGRGQDMHNSVYTPGTSGADQDVDRYRQLGGQYGNTAAPGIDRGLSGQSRAQQTNALGLMQSAAYGNAPSRAEIYGQKLTDDSIDAAMSVGASARGGALAQASAMGQAQAAAAQQRASGARDLSALRAGEMAQARGDYYGAASGMRQQDVGVENYATDNEARQRAMNQADRQFYEQRAWDTRKQEQDSAIRKEQVGNEGWYMGRKAKLEDEENEWGKMKDIANGVGSFVGGIFSDERAKEDVYPIGGGGIVRENPFGEGGGSSSSFNNIIRDNPFGSGPSMGPAPAAAPASASPSAFGTAMKGMGGALSGFGGARNAYAPIRSDANSKYIVSDAHAKKDAFEDGMRYGAMTSSGAHSERAPLPDYMKSKAAPGSMGPLPKERAAEVMGGAGSMAFQDAPRGEQPAPVAAAPAAQYVPAPQAAPPSQMSTYAQQILAMAPHFPSDERAKHVVDLDEGSDRGSMRDGASDRRTYNFDKSFHRDSPADQKRVKRGVEDRASKDADDMMAGYGASLARGASVKDPMADANRAQAASVYAYRPEFTPPEQEPGEKNVGPMAQNLAADPIASTAVRQTPDGLLMLDAAKLAKLHSAGIASLQQQIDQLTGRSRRGR